MRYLFIFLLLASSAMGASRILTSDSLPYSCTVQGVNFSETLFVAGTKISSATNGISFVNYCSSLVLDLGTDTIEFGTGGGDGNYGLYFFGNPDYNGATNIKVIGGTILHNPSDTTAQYNECVKLAGSKNAYIEGTEFVITGYDGQIMDRASSSYPDISFEVNGGTWTSTVTSYLSRCQYGGGAGRFTNAIIDLDSAHFWHWKIHGINLTNTPGQGLMVEGESYIYDCTLNIDARNDNYLTYPQSTCNSSANSAAIITQQLEPGSYIRGNVITSGENYSGCDLGVLVQMSLGKEHADSHVFIDSNTMTLHRGWDVEFAHLNAKGIKERYHNNWTDISYNDITIQIKDGNDSSLTDPYGPNGIGIEITSWADLASDWVYGRQPCSNVVIEHNTIDVQVLEDSINLAYAARFQAHDLNADGLYDWESAGMKWQFNNITSNGGVYRYSGIDGGAESVIVWQDTVTWTDTGTWTAYDVWAGYFLDVVNCRIRDVYWNGEDSTTDDTSIGFLGADDSEEIYLQRTVRITVDGGNKAPIKNADVTMWSINYPADTILWDTTDINGLASDIVNYWYESSKETDTTNYNNFVICAFYDSDSTMDTVTVGTFTSDFDIEISGATGEGQTTIKEGVVFGEGTVIKP